jgi:hypothetical protein
MEEQLKADKLEGAERLENLKELVSLASPAMTSCR